MFKLSSQYLWQWLMVMVILFTMFSGIDSFFKTSNDNHSDTHKEELQIEQKMQDNLSTIIQRLDTIIEKLEKVQKK